MYDHRNGQEIIFGAGDGGVKNITIKYFVNGQETTNVTHTYNIMEDIKTSDTEFNSVIQLTGPGAFINKYIGLKYKLTSVTPENGLTAVAGVVFALGDSYNAVKTKLTSEDAYIPYYDPYTVDPINKAFISYLPKTTLDTPGFGTPGFVWLKGGTYLSDDTEVWSFNKNRTVTIIHNKSTSSSYTVYMISANTVASGTRNNAMFYLRSVDNPDTVPAAPYNRHFVSITTHKMTGMAGSDTTSTFNAVINLNKTTATDTTTGDAVKKMQDTASATISARAFDRAGAAGKTWVRLDPTVNQLNITDYEEWAFKPEGQLKVTVTTVSPTRATDVSTYNFASIEDTSTHRGVFLLSGVDGGKYNNKTISIGIGVGTGTETDKPGGTRYPDGKNDIDADSMRLTFGDDSTAVVTEMENLKEWNFREKKLAQLSYAPIMELVKTDNNGAGKGWAKLKNNGSYDAANTERWNFVAADGVSFDNGVGSTVHDILMHNGSGTPVARYGIKLLDSTSTTAKFQIFRGVGNGDSAGKTNQFVVLERGTGLNEKLMKVGMAGSLDDAQTAFDLVTGFNWSTYDQAVADWGPITSIGTSKWSLTRKNVGDTAQLGSANHSGPAGFFTGEEGDLSPRFDPNNVLEYSLIQVWVLYIFKILEIL